MLDGTLPVVNLAMLGLGVPFQYSVILSGSSGLRGIGSTEENAQDRILARRRF
jgi:hypothetical protein